MVGSGNKNLTLPIVQNTIFTSSLFFFRSFGAVPSRGFSSSFGKFMSYALLAFLVLLVLAFGYFMWQSRDTWRWYHITSATLALLLAILFLFPTAGTLKSRAAWHKVKEDLEAQLTRLKAEQEVLKYGDAASGQGVLDLQEELHRYSVEAGRRWHSLQAQAGTTPASVTLVRAAPVEELPPGMVPEQPPAEAAAGDAAAAAPVDPLPLLPEGLVVYGFAEAQQEGLAVPVFYLGEFRVQSSTPTQAVLTPTGPLEGPQQQAISSGQARQWSLYELLPLDNHDAFVAAGSEPNDEQFFGRVDEELVRRLLGNGASPETIASYLRDGSRALPDDPPASRWVKIEFTQSHGIVVDSPEQRGALDGGFFDSSGQAVDSRLQRGEEGTVSFRTGDQVTLKEEAANQLIDQGVAKLVDTYYIRPLNDYQFVLRRIRLRIGELTIRRQALEFEQKVLQDAVAATVAMLEANQDAKLKLEKDLAQLQIEQAAIASYNASVKENLTSTRQTLSGLYRDNLQLRNELEEFHLEIEEALR